jgi:hypothetical protein
MGARVLRRVMDSPQVSAQGLFARPLVVRGNTMRQNRQKACFAFLLHPLRWMQSRSISGEALPDRLTHSSQP